jgi:DNA polymerase-3 subunit epsilon
MKEYQWWGNDNEPPEYLKTKKQLAEMGLAPVNAVGFIETQKYTLYLYDINNSNSVRPKKQASETQLKNLKKGRIERQKQVWYKYNGDFEEGRIEAVKTSQKLLSQSDWVILDTETTGLKNPQIVEIAVINHMGNPLINTLVKPTIRISQDAKRVHGISNYQVMDAPCFADIYDDLKSVIHDKIVIIYNADFDINVINNCCKIYGLPQLKIKAFCLMELYSQWYGEYSQYWGNYKWQPLPNAGHRALNDCLACLGILKEMAGDSTDIKYPDFGES